MDDNIDNITWQITLSIIFGHLSSSCGPIWGRQENLDVEIPPKSARYYTPFVLAQLHTVKHRWLPCKSDGFTTRAYLEKQNVVYETQKVEYSTIHGIFNTF